MLERVAVLGQRWAARLGRRVTLHIGVHTGPVVAGSLGAAAGAAYAVTGDTVNTASRLLSAAAPGTMLVSDATHALTRHRFAFEPAARAGPARQVRGRSSPIGSSVPWPSPDPARGLAALGLAAPLVGRAAELEQLMDAFERMQRGRAQVVSLVGEAGTGKSRLLAELFARLEAEGRLAGTAVRRRHLLVAGRADLRHSSARCSARRTRSTPATRSTSRGRSCADGLQALGRPG